MLSNTDVICAVIDKITHRANTIQWGIANSFIFFDEAMLHVITQSDFLPWYLQNFIFLMSLINDSKDNWIRFLSYWCFFVAFAFFCEIKSTYLPNCLVKLFITFLFVSLYLFKLGSVSPNMYIYCFLKLGDLAEFSQYF